VPLLAEIHLRFTHRGLELEEDDEELIHEGRYLDAALTSRELAPRLREHHRAKRLAGWRMRVVVDELLEAEERVDPAWLAPLGARVPYLLVNITFRPDADVEPVRALLAECGFERVHAWGGDG
jgi:hypothetical protein